MYHMLVRYNENGKDVVRVSLVHMGLSAAITGGYNMINNIDSHFTLQPVNIFRFRCNAGFCIRVC